MIAFYILAIIAAAAIWRVYSLEDRICDLECELIEARYEKLMLRVRLSERDREAAARDGGA